MNLLRLSLLALLAALLAGCASTSSGPNQTYQPPANPRSLQGYKHYHRVAPQIGWYVVSTNSSTPQLLGFDNPPYREASRAWGGYGYDAVCFRFGPNGRISVPPVYIANMQGDALWMQRLRGVVQGHSTKADLQALFGAPSQRVRVADGSTIWYYQVSVSNPFERSNGSR